MSSSILLVATLTLLTVPLHAAPRQQPTANVPTAGLTFDACDENNPCQGDRACIDAQSSFLCNIGAECNCFPLRIIPCTTASDCPIGERCASRPPDEPFCLSATVIDSDPTYVEPSSSSVPSGPPLVLPPSPSAPSTPVGTTPPVIANPPVDTVPPADPVPIVSDAPVQTPVLGVSGSPSPVFSPLPPMPPALSPSPSNSIPVVDPVSPSPSPNVSLSAVSGLAGDACVTDEDCLTHRSCRNPDTLSSCMGADNCRCLGSTKCSCNDDCFDGEVCSGAPGKGLCFSPTYIDSLPWANTLPCLSPRPKPSPADVNITGLNGEECERNDQCFGERSCVAGGGTGCAGAGVLCQSPEVGCTLSSSLCYCFEERVCRCDEDCQDTEICTEVTRGRLICASRKVVEAFADLSQVRCSGEEDADVTIVVGTTPQPPDVPIEEVGVSDATPTPEPAQSTTEADADDGSVCIDAEALSGFERRQLVFEQHQRGKVLCDEFGSCATAGHIVVYNGWAMMMKRYCGMVECEQRVMDVNSPKLRTALRVRSKTDGLEFTAFAARYATRAEELVLSTAVHVGL